MFVKVDRNNFVSIKKQVYNGLISLILDGTLTAGEKLPSTRVLADQLNIARNSVIEIYEQLIAEEYIYSKKGKGSFVSEIGQGILEYHKKISNTNDEDKSTKSVDQPVQSIISFIAGTPDLNHFPSRHWLNYLKDYLYDTDRKKVAYSNVKGYRPLRHELTYYLKKHKGIRCNSDQIFITNGTSGALNCIGLTMKNRIQHLMTESPVMEFVPDIFKCCDYKVTPLMVDEKGLITDRLQLSSESSLLYTTPSHQMPLGGVMPINRRKELIQYATDGGHYIIEDDYDSEFKYSGAPVNALKQIDTDRVIYLGTFSKTLGPGMRIGYMVVPDSLITIFDNYFEKTYRHVQTMDQYCIYRLINEGQYEKHIYKMTKLYKKKREILLTSIEKYLGDQVEVLGDAAGLHVAIRHNNRLFTENDKQLMREKGIEVDFVTDYLLESEKDVKTDTIIIGFGHLSEEEISKGIQLLGSC